MFEFFKSWLILRQSHNFWDWVRQSFSHEELERLCEDFTGLESTRNFSPYGDQLFDDYIGEEENRRKVIHCLMDKFHSEIWGICLFLGGADDKNSIRGISCISHLPMANEVRDQTTLEEFLVKNALRHAAYTLLKP